MTDQPGDGLDRARQECGLSDRELWLRYFAIGGMAEPLALEAVLHGALLVGDDDHDHVAHALNERFTELGRDHPVPYRNPP